MTKRDFELIASTIKSAELTDEGGRRRLVVAFVNALEKTNPRFDGRRFMQACGLPEWATL